MSDGKPRYIASSMGAKLPRTLTEGVTATRDGLVLPYTEGVCHFAQNRVGAMLDNGVLIRWPDASERLRYREGEPWCILGAWEDITVGTWELSGGDKSTGVLHRLAAILCDDAEAFRVLHWCVMNLGGRGMKYYYAARIEADGGATEIDGAEVVLAEDYDRLWEALSALTAATRNEAAYDDVLHRRLWLYIERAEKVLQEGEDD